MNKIRMFDYRIQHDRISSEITAAVHKVLRSGSFILGDEVASFEKEITEYLHPGGYAIGVASGTDALMLALMALGIRPGDQVITTPNTAVPTISAIRSSGATPVLCDVDPDTALLDIDCLRKCVTQNTKAVVPVHLYGNVVDITKIKVELEGSGIAVIEDCAQSLGSEIDGFKCGTLGDIAAFSFYPTKNLGAYGDAGLCFTRNTALAEKLFKLRTYGFKGRHVAEIEGVNSRLDEIQAAVLRTKLPYLNDFLKARRRLAGLYDAHLDPSIKRLKHAANVNHSYHLYVIRVAVREKLRDRLIERNIETGVHYPVPIHLMPAYGFMNLRQGSYPASEQLATEVLSLPLYPELHPDSVLEVCNAINSAACELAL